VQPNPAKDVLNVECHCGESLTAKQHGAKENTLANNLNEIAACAAMTRISVLDVMGNEVMSDNISTQSSSLSGRLGGASINIQYLKSGIYFVKVNNEVVKVIKE